MSQKESLGNLGSVGLSYFDENVVDYDGWIMEMTLSQCRKHNLLTLDYSAMMSRCGLVTSFDRSVLLCADIPRRLFTGARPAGIPLPGADARNADRAPVLEAAGAHGMDDNADRLYAVHCTSRVPFTGAVHGCHSRVPIKRHTLRQILQNDDG